MALGTVPERRLKLRVGWREWLCLPELGIARIKAKIDTGARTSALHAFQLDRFKQQGKDFVKIWVHPLQRRDDIVCSCQAPLLDVRMVTDSGGHAEERFVIETLLRMPDREWRIELTLTNRENMKFRMLLGRTAMRGKILVEPGKSYVLGKAGSTVGRG